MGAVSSHLRSAFDPRRRILGYPTLCQYPAAGRTENGETVVPRRSRCVSPAVIDDMA